jgi:lipopolysaccharide export LptBFGC system permease protein LptF
MNDLRRQRRFSGVSVGSVLAALLVWGGILTLILAARDPVTAVLIYTINWLRYKLDPATLWIESPPLNWDLIIPFVISGIIYIIAGLALGSWLHPASETKQERP